jgi:hypothetical protein
MIKATLHSPALRKRARQFGRLVRHSAVTPLCGETHKPRLASNGEMGVTFIGHSSFFVQMGGKNVMIDPNFARWLFLLKRLRRPGLRVRDLPAIDVVLVTHAHFDHLHRPSLRAIVQNNLRTRGVAPAIILPSHVTDLVSDLGFSEIIELDWWNSSHHGSLEVTHVPSRHWGARILKDSHRGYGGYVLQAGEHSVYHAGLLRGLSRDWAALVAGVGAASHWSLQSANVPQCAYQSGRCHASFSGFEIAMDGPDALWKLPVVA